MAPNKSSDSDDVIDETQVKIFRHGKSVHQILGEGEVADILLWRNRNISAAFLLGMTTIWFLFEVVEYNFVTLICHISITTILVVHIWSIVADIMRWNGPRVLETILQDYSFFQHLATILHTRSNQLLRMVLYISCGTELPSFLLIIFFLYILSLIGTYFSFVSLLYIGFLCIQTLPIVYDHYKEEINNLVEHIIMDLQKKYRRFKKRYLNKIPRGPVKEKKTI
ncbi:reticulon-like protein B9 [Abrus precatorius]|uniref:Reticulon-like protein n=1 Tax=Abrus precatorius TaxID=3816 RepID=A0A8B8KKB3_ABRPR|nr:reticulon-like protein B9 [Abrus precatorius]